MTGSILHIVLMVLPYVLQVMGFLMHVQGAENQKAVRATAQYDPLTANVYGMGQKLTGDLALIVGTGLHAVNAHRLTKGTPASTSHAPAPVRPIAITGNGPVVEAIANLQQKIQEEHDQKMTLAQAAFDKASNDAGTLAQKQLEAITTLLSQRKIGP